MAAHSFKPTRASGDGSLARDDTPSLLPGEVLGGKYRIDARLAEGGMGVVMRATHLELDSTVAIKLLRAELSGNEDVVARLLAEARIAASLRSKHVNRVLDVGRTALGVPYLVLEYLEGSDLGAYLERRGPLPVAEAADCVLQACEALAEAHAIGIVHRDMKPENLFLAEEADGAFVLKVLDFGISKAPAARRGGRTLTDPFEVVGSPTYMSPEQVRGGAVDARTDVWALGVVLHELCTGNIFFDEESITSTFKRVLDPKDLPPPLPGGEEAARLHAIVVRCLQREPERRFQDMVELAQALAPLGTDGLQAARVAKVAAAARARFIALGAPSLPPLTSTPHALTTSTVEMALLTGERPFAPKRRVRTWSVVAAAAVAAAVSGARHWQSPGTTTAAIAATPAALARPAPTPSLLELAEAEEVAVTEAPRPVASVASVASASAVPPTAWSKPAPRPVAAVAAPPVPPVEVTPEPSVTPDAAEEPTAHLEAEPPPPAPAPPSQASFDAWDPSTFGGRR